MRIDRLDKLDRINFYQSMHSNLVKWWTFTMTEPEECTDQDDEELPEDALSCDDGYDADAMAEELLADALGQDPYPVQEDPFGTLQDTDPEAAAAAMEIFNRLQAEAAADEAARQAEIEAVKLAAASDFG